MCKVDIKNLSVETLGVYVKPTQIDSFIQSKMALIFVLMAHVLVINFLIQKSIINSPKLLANKPMLVSLITPSVSELVPIAELPKPIVQPKPILKKVVEKVKQLDKPVEAATEQVKEEVPPMRTVSVVEAKAASKAEPAINEKEEEKIEPPKFSVAYLNNPAPAYPSLSRRAGEEGRVLLRVLVSENGVATDVQLDKSSGSERLDEAAISAVKNWRFIPARKNNQALSAYVLVPIKFSLNS